MLARAAAAVAAANKLIRALIIASHVVCCDETPVRSGPGPAWRKRQMLVACTSLHPPAVGAVARDLELYRCDRCDGRPA